MCSSIPRIIVFIIMLLVFQLYYTSSRYIQIIILPSHGYWRLWKGGLFVIKDVYTVDIAILTI